MRNNCKYIDSENLRECHAGPRHHHELLDTVQLAWSCPPAPQQRYQGQRHPVCGRDLPMLRRKKTNKINHVYRIRPNYRPCPHNHHPWLFTLFSLITAHLTIFFLTFYFIFTSYCPLDDLLARVVENKFT